MSEEVVVRAGGPQDRLDGVVARAADGTDRQALADIGAGDKPTFLVFNKIDAYRYEEYDEFSLEPKQQINYTLEEFKNSWIAKENTPCIFISAREKIGIDKLRGDLYKMVAEIHAGRYPFDNFLW